MAPARAPSVQLLQSLRTLTIKESQISFRALSTTTAASQDAQGQKVSYFQNPDPETVFIPRLERKLVKSGRPPVGSRRRRMAIATTQQIPFDQLPYQCFQEARSILIADRAEKIKQIEVERARIMRLQQTDPNMFAGGEIYKQKRLDGMQNELERLKILADINDPNVKRRFEDGKGDMNKPIYRFLAEKKWREYRRKIQVQRLEQMKVVPDVVPNLNLTVDTTVRFGSNNKNIQPGDFVDSKISENPCKLNIQTFEKEPKQITIAIVDPDVPNLENDNFDNRCHFLASNITISPTSPTVDIGTLSETNQILSKWIPPTAQKGSPYHRLCLVILQQKDNVAIDLEIAKKKVSQDAQTNFSLRAFMTRHMLSPIGGFIFRTKWDENMAEVMGRAGIDGANVQLKPTKVEPLPYKRRNPSTFR